MNWLGWITWNPDRVLFTIPYIDRPVAWYGFWFALGFIIGYAVFVPMIRDRLMQMRHISREQAAPLAQRYVDRMTWIIVVGMIIGARLGHVFFYEWPIYKAYPMEIFKVWKGGLASHGATVGILIALFIYRLMTRKEYPEFNFITLLDTIVVPTAIPAAFIRIGNFFNQEILGTPSNVPWAVIFGDPADHSAVVPRHPVQLYEAIVYLFTFFLLYGIWKAKGNAVRPGLLSGLFFVLVFGSRFFLEFFKEHQSIMIDESFLQTGQLLSVPLVIAGALLIAFGGKWFKSSQMKKINSSR